MQRRRSLKQFSLYYSVAGLVNRIAGGKIAGVYYDALFGKTIRARQRNRPKQQDLISDLVGRGLNADLKCQFVFIAGDSHALRNRT